MATLQDVAAIVEVLNSGNFILGEQVRAFESEVSNYLGVRHSVGVGNGTDALILSLRALGIGPGSKVAVPAFSFIASASCVLHVGAEPVYVDVTDDFVIDPDQIPKDVDAIIAVHLFGRPCDMGRLLDFGVPVIEDNAQAFGATYQGVKTGSIGTIAAHSFYPTKNLPGVGDGGMITTNDPVLSERVRMLRTHGWKAKYYPEILGYNSRLDEIQAAVLRVRLPQVDGWNMERRAKAYLLRERLDYLGKMPDDCIGHVYNLFTIICNDRREAKASIPINTGIYYPVPLAPLQNASRLAEKVLSIFMVQ